jgi:tetraacyldisaccharide 4'-kinase
VNSKPWTDREKESSARRLARAPLLPLSSLYGLGACLNRKAFDAGLRKKRELPCKVLSVGNIVVGGSGKTPTVAWLANQLAARGVSVAIASRGYGRKGDAPVVLVSDGKQLCASLEEAGDEPTLLAGKCPGVPVLVGPDRYRLGCTAIEKFGTKLLLLDDGFQHMRLKRDVDLITFDGSFGLGNGHILPRGPLREPLSVLSRADVFLIIDGPLVQQDETRLRKLAPKASWLAATRVFKGLRALSDGEATSVESLSGAKVGLLAGLANPENFRRSVEQLGAQVVAERFFPDHHAHTERDLAQLQHTAPLWLTTEKDAVKIHPEWDADHCLRVLEMDLSLSNSFSEAESFLSDLKGSTDG